MILVGVGLMLVALVLIAYVVWRGSQQFTKVKN